MTDPIQSATPQNAHAFAQTPMTTRPPATSDDLRPFWLSWWQTDHLGPFELHTPWWISGSTMDGDASSICAAVMATNEDAARETVCESFDQRPDRLDFRFVTAQPAGWSPYCDRFQPADWMRWPA